jgi:hypothetical protein
MLESWGRVDKFDVGTSPGSTTETEEPLNEAARVRFLLRPIAHTGFPCLPDMKGKHPVLSETCLRRSCLDSVAIGEAVPIVTAGNHRAKRLANEANAYAWVRRQVLDPGCRGLVFGSCRVACPIGRFAEAMNGQFVRVVGDVVAFDRSHCETPCD